MILAEKQGDYDTYRKQKIVHLGKLTLARTHATFRRAEATQMYHPQAEVSLNQTKMYRKMRLNLDLLKILKLSKGLA